MTGPGATGLDEEGRRRLAAGAPASDAGLAILEAALRDPSWRVRKTAATRVVALFPPARIVAMLVKTLGDPADAGARSAAAESLAAVGAAAIPALAGAYAAGDARIRKSILDVLAAGGFEDGAAGRDGAVAELVTAAAADPDPNVRMAAIEAAGRLRIAGIAPLLSRALADREILVRFAALTAVPEDAPLSVSAIEPALTDPLLRRAAVRALGRLSGGAGVPALAALLAGTPDAAWDEALVAVLSRGDRRSAAESLARADRAGLRARVRGAEARIAGPAALALAIAGDHASAPSIAELAVRLPEAAASAASALRELGPEGLDAIAADPSATPSPIAEALGAFVSEEQPKGNAKLARSAASLLPKLASDRASELARFRIALLRAGAGEAAAAGDVVAGVLRDPEVDRLSAATAALGPSALPAIIAAKPDGEPARAAIAELLSVAGEGALAALAPLARDASPRVRRSAVRALSGCGAAGFPEAKAALDDEDSSVRTAALAAIAAIVPALADPASAISAAARLLADRDLLVRVAAVRTLGAIPREEAGRRLVAFESESPLVELALVEALAAHGADPAARERLARFARSPNPDVAALAARHRV